MTNDQLREALTARRAEHLENVSARDTQIRAFQKQMEDLADSNRVSLAHIDEINFSLDALNEIAAPRPVIIEKPQAEKAPRDKCADTILEDYADSDLPDNIDDLTGTYHKAYNARTLRAALNIAHRRRPNQLRASSLPPQTSPPPASVEPNGDGAGPADGFPDIPANLRRAPTRTAAE